MAKGILLPPNAPREYADRQTLWNAVEVVEKQWNSQLSRGIVMALPLEIPKEQYEDLIREYCQSQFVSHGMIADYAIHDKDGNPHAHIMLTLRAMDENGKWLPKCQKVYMLDEHGERIRLPSGEWKSYKTKTTDWDDHGKAEVWRSAWAETLNRSLEKNERPERIDLRSYARQGKETVPTVHLGPAVAHMEQKGIRTEIGDFNRQIVAHNERMKKLKKLIVDLGKWIVGAIKKLKELRNPNKQEPTLYDYVSAFIAMRKEGRADWHEGAKQKAGINDLRFMANVFSWMNAHHVYTLLDFKEFIAAWQASFDRLTVIGKENHKLETALKYLNSYEKLLPIHEQSKRGFARKKEKFMEEHKEELAAFGKACRYMNANCLKPGDKKRLLAEQKKLADEREAITAALMAEDIDPTFVSRIVYCINTVQEAKETVDHQETLEERLQRLSAQNHEQKPDKQIQPYTPTKKQNQKI